AGYRRRRLSQGHLVVVSGGTAHGVAMEAPTAAATVRQRAIAVAEGVMQAAGRVRSPFTVGGRFAWFVEPPHMQVSLLLLPEKVAPPQVGDTVSVRVRHTTLHADEVVLS
ncbi:MAG: alanine racemase, partial [Dermatophilaceae bacterium]